jgi:hypothetical protein
MFHFTSVTTQFKDANFLVAALQGLKLSPTIHSNPVLLNTSWSDQEHYAEIVIDGQQLGIGADIGFKRQNDGTYALIADDYELYRNLRSGTQGFLKQLKQEYARQQTIATCKTKGWNYQETREGNRIQLRIQPKQIVNRH